MDSRRHTRRSRKPGHLMPVAVIFFFFSPAATTEIYTGQLEAALTHEDHALVATLRSDGWFVDEAVGTDLDALAETLALSQRVADFIRNSGLPQQHPVPDR